MLNDAGSPMAYIKGKSPLQRLPRAMIHLFHFAEKEGLEGGIRLQEQPLMASCGLTATLPSPDREAFKTYPYFSLILG